MKLVDMKVNDFTAVLSSDAPAPGGGSVAALEGALGAALVSMVASLTTGKAKYAEYETLMQEILEKTSDMKQEYLLATAIFALSFMRGHTAFDSKGLILFS